MLYRGKPDRIYLHTKIVDFRKRTNGLAQIVEAEFPGQLFKRCWFVFVSRDCKKVKILYWRGTGLALWEYRLDRNRISLGRPRYEDNRLIKYRDLGKFLSGLSIFEGSPHHEFSPKRF